MLDKYLESVHAQQVKIAQRDEYVALMMKLPVEELKQIHDTGVIKLADCEDGKSWIDQFRDTPLFEQAISLEEEELKHRAARQQQRAVEDAASSERMRAEDSLRLQKRLLELDLSKQRLMAERSAATAAHETPGMGIPPGMGAQGAGAPGDVAPEGAQDGAPAKFAQAVEKMKHANLGARLLQAAGQMAKEHPGAVIGGGLGLAHGLLRQDGGLGSGILEGAGGAALGEGAHHLYKRTNGAPVEPGPSTGMLMGREPKMLPSPTLQKEAFLGPMLGALGGAAARGMGASGLRGLASGAMNYMKSNPMKAVGAGLGAASNFAQARQSGQSMGGAALSGLAGGATALG